MEKILIADDNVQITNTIAEFVKKQGFEPVIAYDGRQALDFFTGINLSWFCWT